jgi:hypothetical protein
VKVIGQDAQLKEMKKIKDYKLEDFFPFLKEL